MIRYKESKLFSQNWWKNIIKETLLTEGGAAGHMNHPFDDRDLTFAEMKELVHLSLQGKLNIEADVTEKTDGQNLAVTYKNGKVGAARNKATIREPMDIDAVANKFEGRGDIEKAFTFSPIVYSMHKYSTKSFIESISKHYQFNVTHHWRYSFPIKATFSFHKKPVRNIDVGLWRMEKKD